MDKGIRDQRFNHSDGITMCAFMLPADTLHTRASRSWTATTRRCQMPVAIGAAAGGFITTLVKSGHVEKQLQIPGNRILPR